MREIIKLNFFLKVLKYNIIKNYYIFSFLKCKADKLPKEDDQFYQVSYSF